MNVMGEPGEIFSPPISRLERLREVYEKHKTRETYMELVKERNARDPSHMSEVFTYVLKCENRYKFGLTGGGISGVVKRSEDSTMCAFPIHLYGFSQGNVEREIHHELRAHNIRHRLGKSVGSEWFYGAPRVINMANALKNNNNAYLAFFDSTGRSAYDD